MTVLFKEFKSPSSDQLRGLMYSADKNDYPELAMLAYVDALSTAVTYLDSIKSSNSLSIFQRAAIVIALKVLAIEIYRLNNVGA